MNHQTPPADHGAPHGRPGANTDNDSAGQTWTGRTLPAGGFDGDHGGCDPALAAALESGDEQAVMDALAEARVLVPVVADPTDTQEVDGLVHDTRTDMAVVTLRAPDGQQAMPVFSELASLAAWDPQARPSPVAAVRAAQAALAQGCSVLVLDLAGRAWVVRPSMLWALAQGRRWLPGHQDPVVQQAVAEAAGGDPRVAGAVAQDGSATGPGVVRIALALHPGLDPAAVQDVIARFSGALTGDDEVRLRLDGLAFALQQA